jgi:two-component system phosphate regulon sensor histidine kinase PhoR
MMILRSPIFRKLLASAFVVMAATLAVLDFYLTRYAAQHEIQGVERRLEAQARILAGELRDAPPGSLEPWALEAGNRAGTRVTIIDGKGLVLGDSQHDPETMENHAGRPEIRQAYAGLVGTSLRHSATLDRDLCYVAIPLVLRGQPGFVLRLAVPLEDLNAAIAPVRWRILAASAVAALAALAIAYFFSRSFTRRIGRLRAFAESLVGARFSETLAVRADDELGELARSLNRMAEQLRDLVARLNLESTRREAILASMVEGVLAVDSELRVTFCNASFARTVGVAYPIPENVRLVDLVRDPTLREILARAITASESLKQRMQLPGLDARIFEVQASPLVSPTGRGGLAILHDVTDLERLERVRRDFVANVSHELRTPLTAIQGYTETLLEGAIDDQANRHRFLEIIQTHATRLNSIASDLLTLSELESGKSTPGFERVLLREVVESAMRTVESVAHQYQVSLRKGDLDDAEVMGDRLRLEQAMVNLLDNAVKFNRPGGEVRVEIVRQEDGMVRVQIDDNGIGIPSEDLPRIFERFYRVDKARSREVGGTGLGLSIVKHIVERMNGTVSVESELGKGSTFTVLLPAVSSETRTT